MINYETLEKDIKNNNIKNSYIFCGPDEELIKEGIEKLVNPYIDENLKDLNFIKFDGVQCEFDEIVNACETLPFMTEKKVVIVYRCPFLKEKLDASNKSFYNNMKEYLKDMPSHTILVLYHVLGDKRDTLKKNKNIMALDKITTIVQVDKLKRDGFYKRVDNIFKINKKNINKVELRYFCEKIPMNLEIAQKEVSKLVDYTFGREITRKDIDVLIPNKSEDDVFDLVDLVSQKKIERALDILNELLFKADQHMLIITSIQNQFKRLYDMKIGLDSGKKMNDFVYEYRIPQFVVEKLVAQSNKFSLKQLEKILRLCIEVDKNLKSGLGDKKSELELFLIKIAMVKK
ncbi:DNA polymerase III subunit delta [Clostridium sp. Ade.TY]|uniref:DNA polymerase III subunit delta n=1 Tax=Clostridium sp. Ade.TY TaxID=1391647 RepID=UPI0003F7C07D|nr:DNA polymerase III subunit delta [Clostridium sp. Ade.TY]